MAFQFKQFTVEDDRSSMKVGTDAVLLGSWACPENRLYTLEIGCGSGLISLMLAQKMKGFITAIDIDKDSAEQAHQNFMASKWNNKLESIHTSLQQFLKQSYKKFDIIISNPPFFNNSLNSPYKNRTLSKHTNTLSYPELVKGIKKLLKQDGIVYIILPYEESKEFIFLMRKADFCLSKECLVIPKENKEANRILMEFSYKDSELTSEKLYIRNKDNSYTEKYKQLCKDYYVNL